VPGNEEDVISTESEILLILSKNEVNLLEDDVLILTPDNKPFDEVITLKKGEEDAVLARPGKNRLAPKMHILECSKDPIRESVGSTTCTQHDSDPEDEWESD
jgi:hypothetical protein